MLTIIGSGYKMDDLTLKAVNVLKKADKIIVSSAKLEVCKFLKENKLKFESLDEVYKASENFDTLSSNLALKVKDLIEGVNNACYCVIGCGITDRSAILLSKETETSFVLGVDSPIKSKILDSSYSYISAYDLLENVYELNSDFSCIIYDLDNLLVNSAVKLKLAYLYGEENEIFLYSKGELSKIFLYELDRIKDVDYTTAIILNSKALKQKSVYTYNDLIKIMYILRADNGCEWDKVQTHLSIRHNLIEEAYELVDAINNEDIDNIIEESGDVILQGVFHTVIGEQTGEFDITKPITELCKKLIFRHRHIFGDIKANSAEDAYKIWEEQKAKEKQYKSLSSKMDAMPKTFPALVKAYKTQVVASKIGFDTDAKYYAEKVIEELNEFETANINDKEIEGGDILFSVINLLRKHDISAEVALQRSVNKFINRFKKMEKLAEEKNIEIATLGLEKLDELWAIAKQTE